MNPTLRHTKAIKGLRMGMSENTVPWLRGLAERGGKGVVNNIDARSLGRIADEIERLTDKLVLAVKQIDATQAEIERLRAIPRDIQVADSMIRELRAEIERLRACLDSRDDFLGAIGQWQAYVDTLPNPALKPHS